MARRPALELGELELSIGYAFADRELLSRALTHISALPGTPAKCRHSQGQLICRCRFDMGGSSRRDAKHGVDTHG